MPTLIGKPFLDEALRLANLWCSTQAGTDIKEFRKKLPILLQAIADSACSNALESAYHDRLSRQEMMLRAVSLSERSLASIAAIMGEKK